MNRVLLLTLLILALHLSFTEAKKSTKQTSLHKQWERECGVNVAQVGVKGVRKRLNEISDILERHWSSLQRQKVGILNNDQNTAYLAQSKSCAQLALLSDPTDVSLHTWLGKVLSFQSEWDGAVHHLTTCLEIIYNKYLPPQPLSKEEDDEEEIEEESAHHSARGRRPSLAQHPEKKTEFSMDVDDEVLSSFRFSGHDRELLIEIHLSLSSIYKMLTEYGQANRHLQLAANLDPKSNTIQQEMKSLGSCSISSGSPYQFRVSAVAAWNRGAAQEAIDCLQKSLEKVSSDYESLFLLSQYIAATEHDYQKCVSLTNLALQSYPGIPEEIEAPLAQIYAQRKSFGLHQDPSEQPETPPSSSGSTSESSETPPSSSGSASDSSQQQPPQPTQPTEIDERIVAYEKRVSMRQRLQIASILNMKAFCAFHSGDPAKAIESYHRGLIVIHPISLKTEPQEAPEEPEPKDELEDEDQTQEESEKEEKGWRISAEENEERSKMCVKLMTNLGFAYGEMQNWKESERWLALAIQESGGEDETAVEGLQHLHRTYESLQYSNQAKVDKPKLVL